MTNNAPRHLSALSMANPSLSPRGLHQAGYILLEKWRTCVPLSIRMRMVGLYPGLRTERIYRGYYQNDDANVQRKRQQRWMAYSTVSMTDCTNVEGRNPLQRKCVTVPIRDGSGGEYTAT